jgi:Family of unknown function (DUF6455)
MSMTAPAMHEHRPIQVHEMMARLGIEPSESVVPRLSLLHATAVHRCEACSNKQACRDWLDRMPAFVSLAPHFCPDADILFELRFDQLGAAVITGNRIRLAMK